MDLSVIVPLYNECENVDELYRRIKAELRKLTLTYEIIFIDDGSTDGTREKINEIKKKESELKLIIFNRNYGQTEAIVAGFQFARGDIIITMDGDLQNDPEDIIRIIIELHSGYHLVCGWRKARQDNLLLRKIPSKIANAIISYTTKVKIHDLGCSLKGFRKQIVEHINLYSEMHRFIPIFAASLGAQIAEVSVVHKHRIHGKSKYGIARTWKVLLDLIKIKIILDFSSKPALTFSFFSIPFWFFGIYLIGMYFNGYLNSQVFFHGIPIISISSGILYIFLAFSLVSFGYLTELIIKTRDYKQNKILGYISWIQK